jgi:lysophospholipase L1-like esterase
MKNQTWLLAIACLTTINVSTLRAVTDGPPAPAIKSGDKIAFIGDSITQQGYDSAAGYVSLVISGLATNGIKITPIPAGVSGNMSTDLLARFDRKVLNEKPDWLTLSCGVNDVARGPAGVPLETYKKCIETMVGKAQAAGINVLILTATMIGEDQANPNNQRLIPYNDFLRSLAHTKNCLLADVGAAMQAAETAANKTAPGSYRFTVDGIHQNPDGNLLMAATVLRAFGLDHTQLEIAQAHWLDSPGTVQLLANAAVSLRQYRQLNGLAEQRQQAIRELTSQELAAALVALLKRTP